MIATPPTEVTIKYRTWQKSGHTTFGTWHTNRQSGDSRTFVAAVSGGAGKTYFGAGIAKKLKNDGDCDRVVVICPSNIICGQWQNALFEHHITADRYSLNLHTKQNPSFVTTYHMMNTHAESMRSLINSKTLVIFDECHHLADAQSWGDAAQTIATTCLYRLMLTGTPFREDDAKIPFVAYSDGKLITNYEYSYGDALSDGYVRPVYFKALNASTRWMIDGSLWDGLLHDEDLPSSNLDSAYSLNTALNPKSDWIRTLIEMAHEQLQRIRNHVPNAADIITCKDQNHARAVQRLIQKTTSTNPVLAISDDITSDKKIDNFRDSDVPWLVVVRKGSEGLDIPRLRVGVWATNIRTELSFLQFMFRLVRQARSKREKAYLYMPANEDLIGYARAIKEMRVHAIEEPDTETVTKTQSPKGESEAESTDYEAISATPGQVTAIDMPDHIQDRLELLVKIREHAASAIDLYVLQDAEINVNVALWEIQQLLCRQGAISDRETQPAVSQYELNRQWGVFKKLYEAATAKDWYRDVLSCLWSRTTLVEIWVEYLVTLVDIPLSRLTTNYARDFQPLVDTGLIESYKRVGKRYVKPTMRKKIETIAPNFDSQDLMTRIIEGNLGTQPKGQS